MDRVPARRETPAEVLVVVNLPVEDDHLGAVFVEHRLLAAAQIDNAETPHPEADGALYENALVVRATRLQRGAHAPHQRLGHRSVPVAIDKSSNPAHVA